MKFILSVKLLLFLHTSNATLTILDYPDLMQDYIQHSIAYYRVRVEDPLFEQVTEKMTEICANLSISNRYKMVDPKKAIPSKKYTNKGERFKADENTLYQIRYQQLTVKYNKDSVTEHPVNLFPCPHTIDSQFWFVTYGFKDDIMYLFTKQDMHSPIHFEALIEPTPELDIAMSFAENYLEKNFVNIFNQSKLKITSVESDPLCSLNANQQFRLCSLVDDTYEVSTLTKNSNYSEHYSTHPYQSCLKNRTIMIEEIQKSPNKYGNQRIQVNILPCSVNSPADHPSFYVTHDPANAYTVFVLKDEEDGSSLRAHKFKLKARVKNISVLRHAMDIF